MAIIDDFSVSPTGDIRYTGAGDTYTVIQLHRHLQDLADNAGSDGDDILDISRVNPSDRSTDNIVSLLNGFNIDDLTAQSLFDGSISQDNGDTLYSGLVVLGSLNNTATELQIIQDGEKLPSFWGTGLNASGQNLLRIMVKTRSAGATIDGGRITVQARELGDSFASFQATLGLGNGVAAVSTSVDLNNQTDEATIASWASDFSNIEGLNLIDINNNGNPEEYYSQFSIGAPRTINDLYEFAKWQTRTGSSETLYGLDGDLFTGVTHSLAISNESGLLTAGEVVTFDSGSTAQVLAVSDTELQIQILTGVAPITGATFIGDSSAATGDVDAVVARTVSPVYIGSSTGTSLIGAFGVGVTPTDLTNSDQIFDLSNTLQSVPNFVSFQVSGLIVGEDRVLVGPESAGTLDTAQLSAVAGAVADTTFSVVEVIPSDTPPIGTIRVFDGSTFARVEYSSFSGSTFTLVSSLGVDVVDGADVFISYIDVLAGNTTETFTSVYAGSPLSLFIRVRDGGASPIRPFETAGTLGSAGGSSTVIRTSDE